MERAGRDGPGSELLGWNNGPTDVAVAPRVADCNGQRAVVNLPGGD